MLSAEAIRREFRHLTRAERGSALVEFAFIAPLLIVLAFATVDFMTVIYGYHRAGEATRRGARTAEIVAPIVDLAGLGPSESYVCTGSSNGPTCTGQGVADADSFAAIVSGMQKILPLITPRNVRVEYRYSGIGDAHTPGGLLPMITVKLVDLSLPLDIFGAFPGLPSAVTLPAFAASALGNGR